MHDANNEVYPFFALLTGWHCSELVGGVQPSEAQTPSISAAEIVKEAIKTHCAH